MQRHDPVVLTVVFYLSATVTHARKHILGLCSIGESIHFRALVHTNLKKNAMSLGASAKQRIQLMPSNILEHLLNREEKV
jgi:hypothetical protein